MAYPRFIRSGQIAKARRTAGNITMNQTAWTNVDVALDLVLKEVQVGDQITYGLSARVDSSGAEARFDVVTVVAGTPVNSFSAQGPVASIPTNGIVSWLCPINVITPLAGQSLPYTIASDDLVDGVLILRLRYMDSSTTTRILQASATSPLDVWAMNLGPLQT